jgi:hypothetical protein
MMKDESGTLRGKREQDAEIMQNNLRDLRWMYNSQASTKTIQAIF